MASPAVVCLAVSVGVSFPENEQSENDRHPSSRIRLISDSARWIRIQHVINMDELNKTSLRPALR